MKQFKFWLQRQRGRQNADRKPLRFVRCAALVVPIMGGCNLMVPADSGGSSKKPGEAFQMSSATQSGTQAFSGANEISQELTLKSTDIPHTQSISSAPPRIEDYHRLPSVRMSLEDAVHLALQNNSVVSDLGGRVLSMPDTVRSTFDVGLVGSHPAVGREAALAAFDTHFESGVTFNGGGRGVGPAFSSGQFGVFAQPQTLAKLGFAKVLAGGTAISVGGVAGYDDELAGGAYAALGGELRHPLMRGAGREIQQIAGPFARAGRYSGILIAQSEQHQAGLALEQAVTKLVMDVATTYWELHYAYQNVRTKQLALDNAAETCFRENQRVAAATSPADRAAQAHQQYCIAKAELSNAIAGTGQLGSGVYSVELRLRKLLGLPTVDGSLIVPDTAPVRAEIRFDWLEAVEIASSARVELRLQEEKLRVARLESKAAKNLQLPQVDVLGAYRTLGDDSTRESPVFNQPLDGWQIGIEVRRAVSNRLENAAVRHARLRVSRQLAMLQSQRQFIIGEVREAFTQLDRAFHVLQAMTEAEQAATVRMTAETERHQAGEHLVERVLDAQLRLTEASTGRQRAIVDYNLALIHFHYARGTLLNAIGVAISDSSGDEMRYTKLEDISRDLVN